MTRLRIVALDDTVVFPGMPISLPVDVGEDDKVLLVPRHGNSYGSVGVVAEVSERKRVAGRGLAASMTALHRGVPGAAPQAGDRNVYAVSSPWPSPASGRRCGRI